MIQPLVLVSAYGAGLTFLCLNLHWAAGEAAAVLPWAAALLWLRLPAFFLLLTPVLGAFLPDGRVKFFFQRIGNLWLGYLVWLFLLCVPIYVLGGWNLRHPGPKPAAGIFLLASLAGAVLLLIWGMLHALKIRVNRVCVHVGKSAGSRDFLRIALIADLHLSVNSRPEQTERMVKIVNGQKPDVIFMAGDLFTSTYKGLKYPEGHARALRGLRAEQGVFAVYGNHDVEENLLGGFALTPASQAFRSGEMERFFQDCGFRVLEDEVIFIADGSIQLAGRLDGEKAGDGTRNRLPAAALLAGTDPHKPVLVLQHEPTEFEALRDAGADAAFCGHTHNGQFFPGNLVISRFHKNARGYQRIAGLETFVTSGVGCYGPPMRLGTDSEVMVIELHFTNR